jgi:hypothetical protein
VADAQLKDLTVTEPNPATTRIEPGITVMPEDVRYIYPLFGRTDAAGDLAVTDFRQTTRADHAGSTDVERDPTATTVKATLDLAFEPVTVDMRQMAVMLTGIPQAILTAEPALQTLLSGELQRRLYRALDEHVVAQIDAATPPSGVTGSDGSVEGLVRDAITEMQAVGVNPTVVALNPTDAATVDMHTAVDSITRWPFGLRVVVSPDADAGAPLVLDPAILGHLYVGSLAIGSDPYAGADGHNFTKNLVDLRAEFLAVFVVRNADGVFVASPTS